MYVYAPKEHYYLASGLICSQYFLEPHRITDIISLNAVLLSGHYVPQLSQAIVRYNLAKQERIINLKGYMVWAFLGSVSLLCSSPT